MILLDRPIDRTSAYTLQSIDATGGQRWLRLPLPGSTASGDIDLAAADTGRLPPGFRAALTTVLVPGVTLLVTRATLRSSGTGQALTVVTDSGR